MCGFVGYFGSHTIELNEAADNIRHRGPDMQGCNSGEQWAVAFNRLSIIDVSPDGMQPFTFDGVTVFANGEIYNYRELRERYKNEFHCRSGSDVEIVPFLFRKYGIDFLNLLNGMFSMVIIDEKCKRRYLIRDRYGKKPLYYKKIANAVCFASELKALGKIVTLEPDKTNIALNFFCWFLIQPLTLFKETFNISPGSYLAFDEQGAFQQIRWYEPCVNLGAENYEDINSNFLRLYRDAISLRLRSDVPVGIFLSGGLDSTSMAYIAKEVGGDNVVAFTADITDKELFEGNNTDTEISARLCDELRWENIRTPVNYDYFNNNIVKIISNYEELFVNSGVLVHYALAECAIAHGVKVVLTGVGGDELFGGYPWQSRIRSVPKRLARASLSKPISRCSNKVQSFLGKKKGRLAARLAREHRLLTQTRIWHAETLGGAVSRWMLDKKSEVEQRIDSYSADYFNCSMHQIQGDLYNQWNFANIFTVIGAQNNLVDMACMYSSVENRSPLLDYRLFEYMMTVPDSIKTQGGPKGLLRKILSDFMPEYVVTAKKSGPTMPLHIWFSEPSRRVAIVRFLFANIALISDYVSSHLAAEIKKNPEIVFASKSLPAFALLSFVIWAKIHIENSLTDASISFEELLG